MCESHRTGPPTGPHGTAWSGPAERAAGACMPADARRAVERAVADRCHATGATCDREALCDALLVTSELTTNAILHGGGITDFGVDVCGGGVRVRVSDRCTDTPVTRPPVDPQGRSRFGGHGWPLVCRLARDVRVSDLPAGGKCISALVPLG